MKTNHRLLLKHGLSGTCLGLLLLIGSGSNAEDLGIKNLASTIDSWRISSKADRPGWFAQISIRPASFVRASTVRRDQPQRAEFADNRPFRINLNNDPEAGWQIMPYTDDGIGATERDDSYGLSFTRQW
ncbi:MAG: hypothetical protein KDI24_11225 [Pseudomonadales bacterium]|nr:hypothetical protein [Pseudomonadales bacterium]MCP5172495.1 hypothetical protein [Pseudomonadales bacterium]